MMQTKTKPEYVIAFVKKDGSLHYWKDANGNLLKFSSPQDAERTKSRCLESPANCRHQVVAV